MDKLFEGYGFVSYEVGVKNDLVEEIIKGNKDFPNIDKSVRIFSKKADLSAAVGESPVKVKIDRNISDAAKYEVFLKDCYGLITNTNFGLREATAHELAVTIINGPFTDFASSKLVEIVKQYIAVLTKLAENQTNANNFANFVARTHIIKEIFPFIKDSTEPEMIELKQLAFKLSKYCTMIEKALAFTNESLRNEDLSAFLDLMMHMNLLEFYNVIDKEFVHKCMKKMLDTIPAMIECIISPTTSADFKNQILKVILLIFTYSPLVDFNGDDIYDFEPLLNIYIYPDNYELDFKVDPNYLGMVLSPSFSKLGKSHLKKFLSFLEEKAPEDCTKIFTKSSLVFLRARIKNEDIFCDALNVMHEFYQENQLDIGQVLKALLITQSKLFNASKTQRMVKFCIENKIFSKTFEKAATKLASNILKYKY